MRATQQTSACHPDMVKALVYLQRLAEQGFWGSIRVKLQAGRATQILIEESVIPSELAEDLQKSHASSIR
jgi:hypothetical protein